MLKAIKEVVGQGILESLKGDKSGIPKTVETKNRSVLIVVDRKERQRKPELVADLWEYLSDLYDDRIDSITIDVKERTWK